jgi:hypothetical protein
MAWNGTKNSKVNKRVGTGIGVGEEDGWILPEAGRGGVFIRGEGFGF